MRIAIATDNGQVGAHFGHCPTFTIADITDGAVVSTETLANPGHAPGAIPRFLKSHGVEAIIAGGMGRRAQDLFDEMSIQQVVGVTGSVEAALSGCLDGTLEGGESLCSHGDGHGDGTHGLGSDCDHYEGEQ